MMFIILVICLLIPDATDSETTTKDGADITTEDTPVHVEEATTKNPIQEVKKEPEPEDKIKHEPLPPDGNLPHPSTLESCDKETNEGCNITNFERCVLIRERSGRCTCLPGYARGPGGKACVAIKYYRSQLKTLNPYTDEMSDRSSSLYRKLEYQTREALFQAVMNSKLRSIGIDVAIRRFLKSDDGNIIVDFEISLSRSYAPEARYVEQDLREGVLTILTETTSGTTVQYKLDETDVVVDKSEAEGLIVTDPEPCGDPMLNYCDDNAICVATIRSFSCRCKDGYADVSPNKIEAPGEKCELRCGCENEAVCKYKENGDRYCECPSWYLGTHCEIDGKLLLIGVACILGGLLLIGIICCACCVWKMKMKNKRRVSDNDSVHSRESMAKVPRSWLDTWRYYSFNPAYNYPNMGYPMTVRGVKQPPNKDPPPVYPVHLAIPRPHVVAQPPPQYYQPEEWFWSQNVATSYN